MCWDSWDLVYGAVLQRLILPLTVLTAHIYETSAKWLFEKGGDVRNERGTW